MEPERPFCGQVFSVSELNGVIKQMLEGVFAGIFVEGEISNLREAASGHIYFEGIQQPRSEAVSTRHTFWNG